MDEFMASTTKITYIIEKKIINPLDSPIKTLQLGGDMAMHKHLGLLYQMYTFDQHGPKLEDIHQSNIQNWA